MLTLYVRRDDYTGEASWRLLDWCLRRGADEFSLAFLGPPYLPRTTWAAVDNLLAPFRRRVASAGDRWLLTGESAAVLRHLLAGGLLGGGPEEASLAGLTVYRGGAPLLQVEMHTGRGMLHARDDEESSLAAAALPVHRHDR